MNPVVTIIPAPVKTFLDFNSSDMDVFLAASHDASPIHVSDLYARRTSFGQPVVYGVLGFLRAASQLAKQASSVSELALEFLSPLFLGVKYASSWDLQAGGKIKLRIEDGNRVALRSRLCFQTAGFGADRQPFERTASPAARPEAASWSDDELRELPAVSGSYQCDERALAALEERFGLSERGLPEWMTTCLLWVSQFVGMELPGSRALLSSIYIRFAGGDPAKHPQLNYRVVSKSYDERFGRLSMEAEIRTEAGALATALIGCYVREERTSEWQSILDRGRAFEGKTVFIVGASRGLGAMIARAFGLQGASVLFSYHKSKEQADQLLSGEGAAKEAFPGDASDIEWCRDTAERIRRNYGRLDYMVLNACPALNPLSISETTAVRINEYVSKSIAMALYPFSAFAPLLCESQGLTVLVSSNVVEAPFTDLPQYGMAKCALEHLVTTASEQYPSIRFHTIRPGRLRTDFSNTPLGKGDAESPAAEAKRLLDTLRANRLAELASA